MTICPCRRRERWAAPRICTDLPLVFTSAAARPYRRPCHAAAATVPMSSSRYAYATVRAPSSNAGRMGPAPMSSRHRIRSQQARRKQRVGHHIGERAIAFLVAMILPSQYRTAQRPAICAAGNRSARNRARHSERHEAATRSTTVIAQHASGMSHPAQPRGSSTSRSDPATSVSIQRETAAIPWFIRPAEPARHPAKAAGCRTDARYPAVR